MAEEEGVRPLFGTMWGRLRGENKGGEEGGGLVVVVGVG